MIKTVIFDMDGVIVDTEPLHYDVTWQQFKELGIEMTSELHATFTGSSNRNIYQRMITRFGISESLENLLNTKNELFVSAFNQKADLELLPGVLNLIKDLYANGMQLIVASSSEHHIIDMIFERFSLNQYFAYRVSGNDFPESKPNPDIFLKAVELSGMHAENCIVIEDSYNGIIAAKAAGLYCIAYKGDAEGQDQSPANKIIYNFADLNFKNISEINS